MRGQQRFARLIQRRHGFDSEHVDSGSGQCANLPDEGETGFIEAGFAQRLKANTERADGSRDPGCACLAGEEALHCLTGDAHRQLVLISATLPAETIFAETEAVCAEGVGFEDFRACLQVFFVHGQNERWIGEIQLIEAAADEDSAAV